jgi:hypothetical protein
VVCGKPNRALINETQKGKGTMQLARSAPRA